MSADAGTQWELLLFLQLIKDITAAYFVVVYTLCDPTDCSTPDFPVHHQFRELTQTHVHHISDAIQPSHPLLSPSSLALNFSQHQGLSNESALHIRWRKYWSFSLNISPSSEYSGLISLRMDWFKSINSSVLSLLYNPTLTSIHDYWKNNSFD